MKVINTGKQYVIYDDTMEAHDYLPAQAYSVRFDKLTGFYLEKHAPMEVKETKIYGAHKAKVDKVMNAFQEFNRNLGVILSGDKGIGKSLFARLLSIEAVNNGYPLIIVDSYIPGIAAYLESIEQETVVLFDEFDKTFKEDDDEKCPQSEMLSLFDGTSSGKKLFIITCNYLGGLNDYLINRPGRFHYHFRFTYPKEQEIREYMEDKLTLKSAFSEIDKVIAFAQKIELNYDCLKAIAFELNHGESFESAIEDLNIINWENPRYEFTLHLRNNKVIEETECIDLFSSERAELYFYSKRYDVDYNVSFEPKNAKWNSKSGSFVVKRDSLEINPTGECDKDDVLYLTFKKDQVDNFRFMFS